MIEIRYAAENGRHRLHIYGHAGYGEYGADIVCAGVSAITFALLGYLELGQPAAAEVDITAHDDETVRAAFAMAVCGYRQIADQYPDHVRFVLWEEDGAPERR